MKITNQLLKTGALSVCAFSLIAGVNAQDAEGKVRVGDQELRGTVDVRDRDADLDRSLGTSVRKINKASSLIGMDVRNQQNERLGEIHDLVVDFNSGKIAYAVLSVGGFLGIGEKYIAVPVNAFKAAPDEDKLVLNADKERVQNATGFAKNDWPALNSDAWRSQSALWVSPDDTARGTAGTTRFGTQTERVDRDARDLTTTDRQSFRGRITAVNPEEKTMTVTGPSGTREFKLEEKATITLKDNKNARLVDLKVGYPVTVGFHKENGSYVAHSVIRTDTPEVK